MDILHPDSVHSSEKLISTAYSKRHFTEIFHEIRIYSNVSLVRCRYVTNITVTFTSTLQVLIQTLQIPTVDLVFQLFEDFRNRQGVTFFFLHLIFPKAKEDTDMLRWLRPLWECIGNNFIAKIQVPSFPEQQHPRTDTH